MRKMIQMKENKISRIKAELSQNKGLDQDKNKERNPFRKVNKKIKTNSILVIKSKFHNKT